MEEKIKVGGMHCEHCESKITKGLMTLEGVDYAKADYKERVVDIIFDDSKISLKDIRNEIKKLGFKA